MGFALLRRVAGRIELVRSWQIGTRGSEDLENRIFDLCLQARPIMRAALEAGARMLVIERSAPINRGGKGIAALQIAWSMGLVCGAIAGTWALSGAPCKYVKCGDWRKSLKGLLDPVDYDFKKPAIELARKFYGINAGEDEAQAIWLGYACLQNKLVLQGGD